VKNAWISFVRIMAFLALTGCYLQAGRTLAQAQDVQAVEVTAKKYEYSPAPIHVKRGTKVQLKITAMDHDHGFKIATFPDGAAQGAAPGLVFASGQDCWQLKKENRQRSSSWHRQREHTHSSVVTLAGSATEE
jgi:plastocyanin